MYKVDFHTHSSASPDGSIRPKHYHRMLEKGCLDFIAITDHNTIDMALRLKRELGDKIIIGEEITTTSGELIGLYLSRLIPAGLTLKEVVCLIHEQGGLVYVPHPFETVRKGLTFDGLNSIATDVDILEIHNGRAVFQNYSSKALAWTNIHLLPGAAASDAHGVLGWGRTYTVLKGVPTKQNLTDLLQDAQYTYTWPGLMGILYPKLNRMIKRFIHD
jgi:predicted metal-dependent phosphoesterase TrpH